MTESTSLAYWPQEALDLLSRATRAQTACGNAQMVWHIWGSGEPLVLLHGGSGSWLHWLRNIDSLVACGRLVIVPDLPGFGDSAAPPGGQDADGVMEPLRAGWIELQGELGVDGPVEVAGFSFGGIVAGFWLDQHPQDLRRLVITGSPGFGFSQPQRESLRGWRHLSDPVQRMAAHRHNLAVLMLHAPSAIDEMALWIQAVNTPRDRMGRRRLAATSVLAPIFERSTVPVRFVYGDEDVLYQGRYEPFEQWIDSLPASQGLYRVAGAGHWVNYEDAPGWLRAAF